MRDQTICKEIAQLVFNEAPCVADKFSVSAYIGKGFVNICIWNGEKLSASSSFALSSEGTNTLMNLFKELNNFYKTENMGLWNIAFFTIDTKDSAFNIEFDLCEELDTGKLSLWRYRMKYE